MDDERVKYFTPCRSFFDDIFAYSMKKITPVNSMKRADVNIDKLYEDITTGLMMLNKNNMSHGDASLDNIGFDGLNYVLFDYNTAKITPPLDDDLYFFEKSLRYFLSK
jgi:tRNA A-37 threonylcarbamoyl transferase component Bud32